MRTYVNRICFTAYISEEDFLKAALSQWRCNFSLSMTNFRSSRICLDEFSGTYVMCVLFIQKYTRISDRANNSVTTEARKWTEDEKN